MTELSCEELLIPSRLWRIKGTGDKKFNDGSEYLYRRFSPDVEITIEGRLGGAAIKDAISPPFNVSCNRSSMCEHSTDVLYNIKNLPHRFDYGVLKATVDSIKGHTISFEDSSNSNKELMVIKFEIEHKPEKCMYPHSEIVIYKNEIKIEKASKTIKTLIRDELVKAFTLCHKPDPEFTPAKETKQRTILAIISELFEKLIGLRS